MYNANRRKIDAIGVIDFDQTYLNYFSTEIVLHLDENEPLVQEKRKECLKRFMSNLVENCPDLASGNYNITIDTSLRVEIAEEECSYTVIFTFKIDDEDGKTIYSDYWDTMDIDMNSNDAEYLKLQIIRILSEKFLEVGGKDYE